MPTHQKMLWLLETMELKESVFVELSIWYVCWLLMSSQLLQLQVVIAKTPFVLTICDKE